MFFEKLTHHAYRIAAILFSIFIVNILVGKISLSFFDSQLPLGLGGAIEFLLMSTACICFVIGILRSESLNKKNK